jgi:hypothetical protein
LIRGVKKYARAGGADMTAEAERYWKEFEDSTGEHVEARCMGQWLGPDAPNNAVWGLLVLTDRSLHFIGQESTNWFSGLFTLRGKTEGTPVKKIIAREELLSLNEAKRGFLVRLTGPGFPHFSITWKLSEGGEGFAIFEVDDRTGFIKTLRGAISASKAADTGDSGKSL